MFLDRLLLIIVLVEPHLCEIALTDAFLTEINSKQKLWKAGKNPLEDIPDSGGTENPCRSARRGKATRQKKLNFQQHLLFPRSFDARGRWPHCSSLNAVPHQGRCANSWAVAAVAAVADRRCIESSWNWHATNQLSAEDLTTCCPTCVRGVSGCYKGNIHEALRHLSVNGVVSGDHHGTAEGCKPYSDDLFEYLDATPMHALECKRRCTNEHYDYRYEDDVVKIVKTKLLPRASHGSIMKEIFDKGPVVAVFKIYKDFFAYHNGVYVPQTTEMPSWHTVNLIGWGTANGVPFWWARNSWGKRWGKLGGFFKIRRTKNDALIESYVYTIRVWTPSGQRTAKYGLLNSLGQTSAPLSSPVVPLLLGLTVCYLRF